MAIEGTEQNTLRDVVSEQFDAIIPDADNPPVNTPMDPALSNSPAIVCQSRADFWLIMACPATGEM